jgi:serine/threonine protein kinase
MTAARDPLADLPLGEQSRVNAICDRFEDALREGLRPSLEDSLGDSSGAVREVLLRELLVLECEWTLREGREVDGAGLAVRFPGRESLVRSALELARGNLAIESVLPERPPGPSPRVAEAPAVPDTIGRFRLLRVLGQGAFGTVYRALDTASGCEVALKVPHVVTLVAPELRERFLGEARAAALDHPCIARIREVGEVGLVCFIASEYVPGPTLAAWLRDCSARQERVAFDFAARLTVHLAGAIQHAHERGVLHCDLKPANVLLRDVSRADPVVTDFGLARVVGSPCELTGTGQVLGTPAYMAPEQAAGRRQTLGPATDVYGLGAILYEMLTGRPPFQGASPLEVLEQKRNGPPVSPRVLAPRLPRDLETVCLKALEERAEKRYGSAAALADDLERWLRGERVRARRVGPLSQLGRWARRKPVVACLVLLLGLTVVAALAISLGLWRQALANLEKEEVARQEAEDHYAMLRQLLTSHAPISTVIAPGNRPLYDPDPLPDSMLADAETSLSGLLRRRPQDHELRALLAAVLTRRASRQARPRSPDPFERAAHLWQQVPPEAARQPRHLAAQASTWMHLGLVRTQQGQHEQGLRAYETSYRLWLELGGERPDPLCQEGLFYAALGCGHNLIWIGRPETDVLRRFEDLRRRPALLGGERGFEVLLAVLRAERLCHTATGHYEARRPAAGLTLARQAAVLLGPYYRPPFLDRTNYLRAARPGMRVAICLRKGGAVEEALGLAEQVNRSLQELGRAGPATPPHFEELSQSWQQIGKAHWQLGRVESAVEAYREALAAQRQVCTLAPAVAEYRQELGSRYLQLGRKLCELGRLGEAEACFRERQALWPGDPAMQAEALRELRKWAAQVGDKSASLSVEQRQERQRYLELSARLEGRGR